MPDDKIGANLFMCIPPDHMRNDLPTTVSPWDVQDAVDTHEEKCSPCVYVGITDDMGNTVTLPCFDVQYIDGKVVVMAHRTGRPDKTVVDMPFQTEFFVRWRDGLVTKESFWHGLVLNYGPSQMGADLYSDGTVEEIEWPNYRGTKGARWFRTKAEAEAKP